MIGIIKEVLGFLDKHENLVVAALVIASLGAFAYGVWRVFLVLNKQEKERIHEREARDKEAREEREKMAGQREIEQERLLNLFENTQNLLRANNEVLASNNVVLSNNTTVMQLNSKVMEKMLEQCSKK